MSRETYSALLRRAGRLIDPDKPAKGPPPQRLWLFIGWCLRGAWPAIGIAALIAICASVTEVVAIFYLGKVVDTAVTPIGPGYLAQHWDVLAISALMLLVLRPLFFGGLSLSQTIIVGPNLFNQIMARLYRWTIGQSISFFDDDFAGRLAQKKLQTATSLTEAVVEAVNAVVFGLAAVAGTAVLLTALDSRLAVLLLLWFAGYVLFLRWMLPRIRVQSMHRATARAEVTGQVVDTISNIKTVKLFAGSEQEDKMVHRALASLRHRTMVFGRTSTQFRFGLVLIAGLLPAIVVGAALALPGQTPGSIAAAGALTIRLSQMTGWISFAIMIISGHIGEVEDGMKTLTARHDLTDQPDAQDIDTVKGAITFAQVSYAYGKRVGGVSGIDLTLKPGEKIGIVGASGAGKSTLVHLLLRLFDPEQGEIRIDETPIRSVTQDSLRAQIGMVTQETAMFNRSAMENIRYGCPDASDDQVYAAAQQAEAHDFITKLRDHNGRTGYAAHLGERGVKLSGGQRQRIALARAILKDAPILVLDEATSALDSEVEAQIQTALGRVMEGKTVLAIAHRLSTLATMDRIIVLDQGQIVEQGTHDDLLGQNGKYAQFWHRQSGGLDLDAKKDAAE